MIDRAHELREFWFGRLPLTAPQLAERMRFWFGSEETPAARRERDRELRARYEPLVVEAAAGKLSAWADSPRRRLSLILLLDQLPRNLYRDTPRAFAMDERALALALSGIQSGADAALDVVERIFFYMPLEHAESLEAQEESVAAFRRLLEEASPELRPALVGVLEYAEAHRALIQRFGRFPHRNRMLGRASTREERQYLESGSYPVAM
ncbi:MAG TPA: DUF924 family protein [Steroidobacteraceae bacterium]|nr:DUF924 family protein [Steroidobacteraceae bacterium]